MFIDDGLEVCVIDKEGRRRHATSTNFKFNDEDVFQYDPETGILRLSMEPHLIDRYIESIGGLPAKDVGFKDPFGGRHHFDLVKEVKSLPRKDGTYFLVEQKLSEPKKSWFRRLFG